MSVLGLLTAGATLLSGLVALGVLVGGAYDLLLNGGAWIQRQLGIDDLREDHRETQSLLIDVGEAHNELADVVCDYHDVPQDQRPTRVNVRSYRRDLSDQPWLVRDGEGQDD